MIKDITLGQYYPGESIIHGLDPRIKILTTLIYIIAAFAVKTFVGMALLAIMLFCMTKAGKIPVKFMLKGLKPIFLILILTFILNAIMLKDGESIFKCGAVVITEGGLKNAFLLASRLILLMLASSWLTLTTKPIALTDGIEMLLKPLERFKVPAHDIAMMMTIALRFIPTLVDETDKIIKAQTARGADFETGNVIKRATNFIPLLVPLFISSLRMAQELAMAMEARCYRGGKGRPRMHELKISTKDIIFILFIFIFTVIILCISHII